MKTAASAKPVCVLLPENETFHPWYAGTVSRWLHEVISRLPKAFAEDVQLVGKWKVRENTFKVPVTHPYFLDGFIRFDRLIKYVRPGWNGAAYCLNCYAHLKRARFVIIQNRPEFAIWLRRFGYKGKIILHLQNDLFNKGMGESYRLKIQDSIDRIISCSFFIGEQYKEVLPALYTNTSVISNAADPSLFKPGIEKRQPAILYAGRTIPEKGLDLLTEAFTRVQAEIPTAQLWIAGSTWFGGIGSAYETRLKSHLEPLIAAGRVRWLGYLDHDRQLPEVMAAASLFCLPGLINEAMPLSVIEAMLSGTPVVTTESGGGPEALGGTGLVVPMRNVEALAGALIQLLTDHTLWQQKQQAALARAREHYTWDKVAGDFAVFLKEHCT